ncbi:MAG: MFS transporter, partial [Burkholderiaceae bacterium]|nr:MFS transporter [Burkholderiaceae bacterium]
GLHLPVQVRVYAAFFLYAFSMGGFYPRLPELQVQMGVGEGTLGLAIMGVAAGMLVSLTFFVPQLERMRSRTVLLTTLPVISIAFALASHMRAAVAVFFFLFLVGLVMGFIETIVNLEADRIEHQTGTRIMNRSHGFWSIGFFAGGAISAVFARFDISPQSQLWVTAGVVYLLMVLLLGRFQPTPARTQHPTTPETPRWATPTKGILLLVS